MNNRIANDLIRYAELVEDGALISPEEMNCASVMRLAAEALAQPAVTESHKQDPVAYGMWDSMIGCGGRMMYVRLGKGQDGCTVPLYTTPPYVPTKRQRKPLTDEEIERLRIEQEFDQWAISEGAFKYAARAIEAAHGIKE